MTDEITARQHSIAADAAWRIANRAALRTIETEPLEALADWISFELQDRDRRDVPQTPQLF